MRGGSRIKGKNTPKQYWYLECYKEQNNKEEWYVNKAWVLEWECGSRIWGIKLIVSPIYQYLECYNEQINKEEQYANKAWDWEYEVCEQNMGNRANCVYNILLFGVL